MTAQNRATLKGYFNSGDTPIEAQFADLIDSFPLISETSPTLGVFNVKDAAYGAKGDSGFDESTSVTGTAIVTSVNIFATDGSDVGRTVFIPGGGTGGAAFYGTIASVTDAKHATLSGAVTTNTSARTFIIYRTDDTAAFTAAINAASAVIGGKVVIPPGVYNTKINISSTTRRLYMSIEGAGPSTIIAPPQNAIGIYAFAAKELFISNLKIVGGLCGIWTNSNPRGRVRNVVCCDQVFGTSSPSSIAPWSGDGLFVDGDDSTEILHSDITCNRCAGIGVHYFRGTTQDNGGFYLNTVLSVTNTIAGTHGLKVQGQGGGKGYAINQTGASGTVVPHPNDTTATGMTLTFNTDANGSVSSFTVAGGTGYARAPYLVFPGTPTIPASLKPYSGTGASTAQVHPTAGGYGAGSTYTVITNVSGSFVFLSNVVCDGYSDTLTPAASSAFVLHNAANIRAHHLWATGSVSGKGAMWLSNVVQSEFGTFWPQNGNDTDTTASHVRLENACHDITFDTYFLPKSAAYGFSSDGTSYNIDFGTYTSDLEQRTTPTPGVFANDFTLLSHQTASSHFYRYRSPSTFVTSVPEGAYGAMSFYDAAVGAPTPRKFIRVNNGSLEWLSNAATAIMSLSDTGALSPMSLALGAAIGSPDSFLVRDSTANALALRNGGTQASPVAQSLRLYNFWASTTDYERLNIGVAGGTAFQLSAEKAGTGTIVDLALNAGAAGAVRMRVNGTTTWVFNTAGLLANTDNAIDIGATAANRPRSIYAGTNMRAAGEFQAAGAGTGVAGSVSYTGSQNTGTARSTGVGTIKFADAVNRDNAGFVKVMIGTTAYYMAAFLAN